MLPGAATASSVVCILDDVPHTVEQIAEQEHISTRQVSRDRDAAIEQISMLMFGIDGLELV